MNRRRNALEREDEGREIRPPETLIILRWHSPLDMFWSVLDLVFTQPGLILHQVKTLSLLNPSVQSILGPSHHCNNSSGSSAKNYLSFPPHHPNEPIDLSTWRKGPKTSGFSSQPFRFGSIIFRSVFGIRLMSQYMFPICSELTPPWRQFEGWLTLMENTTTRSWEEAVVISLRQLMKLLLLLLRLNTEGLLSLFF